ncbi:hypothetical protein OJ996_20435 [Luteolibacter sp. GHJ8]|uniref:Helix-turn-helix domain-containing protein n=1 Tax=Luteolibacter rhizosphaerae TaxID=2989719 RepID=A0ABT3G7Y2_9BACT|nr:hypothetical protein [Luteolibacter rhizosphaerae]MCW1915967.1 hypothetical protein [Luteolibacter rhizosphaerae]
MQITLTLELSQEQVEELIAAREDSRRSIISIKSNSIFAPSPDAKLLPPRWLSLRTAKDYCSLSTGTLQRACALGLIVSHMVGLKEQGGGRRLIDRLSLDAWIMADYPGWRDSDYRKRKRKKEKELVPERFPLLPPVNITELAREIVRVMEEK